MAEAAEMRDVGGISRHPVSAVLFEWTIQDYFSLPQESDFHIYSPVFTFLDATWRIFIAPNGHRTRKTEGWMGLFLNRASSKTSSHTVTYRFSIRKKDGSEYVSSSDSVHFKGNMSRGTPELVKSSQLKSEEAQVVPGGILTIFINLSAKVEETTRPEAPESVNKLLQDFKQLLESGDKSDVTVMVKEEAFKVHKAVLAARAPELASKFKHELAEERNCVIQIKDCDPENFRHFLAYLYYGKLEFVAEDNAISLYVVADKYGAKEMKDACVKVMVDNLTVDSFCDLFVALQHDEPNLREKFNKFFAENIKSIIKTTKWSKFNKQYSEEATELHITALDVLLPD